MGMTGPTVGRGIRVFPGPGPRVDRGGPHCLDSAAAELRWTLRFIVRLPKSVAGSPHRRRSG